MCVLRALLIDIVRTLFSLLRYIHSPIDMLLAGFVRHLLALGLQSKLRHAFARSPVGGAIG